MLATEILRYLLEGIINAYLLLATLLQLIDLWFFDFFAALDLYSCNSFFCG
jgi:hypothetical protein